MSRISLAWLVPVAIAGFFAVNVAGLDQIFSVSSRWGVLAALIVFLLWRGRLFQVFRLEFTPLLVLWLIWNIATTLWSEQPLLSLMKAGAMALSVIAFTSAGLYWMQSQKARPFFYLIGAAVVTCVAALPGPGSFVTNSAGVRLYQGLCLNPNVLAEYVVITLCFCLYRLHLALSNRSRAWTGIWAAAIVALLAVLVLSGSRAAALSVTPLLLCFFAKSFRQQTLIRFALVGVAIVGLVIALPGPFTGMVKERAQIFLHKGRDNLLFSRQRFWDVSVDDAVAGGMTGAGFGVSRNSAIAFDGGFSSAGRRQKANSQLAMIEETGWLGLAIFLVLLLQIYVLYFPAAVRRTEPGFALALMTALLVQSGFEDWWTSPGAVETIVLWVSIGVLARMVPVVRPALTSVETLAAIP